MLFQDGSYQFVCLIKSYDEWDNVVCMFVGFISTEKIILCKVGNFLKFIVNVSYFIPSS